MMNSAKYIADRIRLMIVTRQFQVGEVLRILIKRSKSKAGLLYYINLFKSLAQIVMKKWQDHIESTPDVLKGKPRIKNTRIPVSLILGYLASGYTNKEIIKEFPDLTQADIAACLSYARDLSEFEAPV